MKKEKKKKHIKRVDTCKIKTKNKTGAESSKTQDPLQYAVSAIGGKWKIRILWAVKNGNPLRYREIKQLIPEVTDMMLSQSLRELTECGLMERRQYQEIPPKVEYRITESGKKLMPAIELLSSWAKTEQLAMKK